MSLAQILSRAVLIAVCTSAGYVLNDQIGLIHPTGIGLFLGFGLALFVLLIEAVIRKFSLKLIFGGTIGLAVGLAIAWLVSYPLGRFMRSGPLAVSVYVITAVMFGYIGVTLGSGKIGEIRSSRLSFLNQDDDDEGGLPAVDKLIDTSALIDGRLAGVAGTGFIDGRLIVPRFVLLELQTVADSPDHVKRQRGRRGLDVLGQLKETTGVELIIGDEPSVGEVDQALIDLAVKTDRAIVTTDYNLAQVARLHGVKVLNLNVLAEELKPAVLPGEVFKVQIIREGKSPGQGVGYLEDGTMVVVENGRSLINSSVQVQVTSILQTPSGRMIFTELTGRRGAEPDSPSA